MVITMVVAAGDHQELRYAAATYKVKWLVDSTSHFFMRATQIQR